MVQAVNLGYYMTKKLGGLYKSPSFGRMVNYRKMRWVENAARMSVKNVHNFRRRTYWKTTDRKIEGTS
jgi:hypothetical protein